MPVAPRSPHPPLAATVREWEAIPMSWDRMEVLAVGVIWVIRRRSVEAAVAAAVVAAAAAAAVAAAAAQAAAAAVGRGSGNGTGSGMHRGKLQWVLPLQQHHQCTQTNKVALRIGNSIELNNQLS